MRVKGVYEHNRVKLLEAVDVPDGTEVEVILPEDQDGQLASEQQDALQATKGVWTINEQLGEALEILEDGWKAWQFQAF